ncbi:MAG: DNA-processing protein DprA [Actinomycetota bacterium]
MPAESTSGPASAMAAAGGAGSVSAVARSVSAVARWPEGFAGGLENRRAALVLMHLRGLTPRRQLAVGAGEGTASATLAAIRSGTAGTDGDRAFLRAADPAGLDAAVDAAGARFVAVGDPEYPPGLSDLADPPLGLFLRGRPLEPLRPAVAIVGARNCTAYGAEVAAAIGRGLATAGVIVVSGGARGIDGAAHRGALDAGWTVAVLGSGIDVAYPAGNRALLARVRETGTIVSEYAPGVPAEPFRFPARNRIVAAMARATVVVEGAAGSGSTITVDHAHDCGREVLAVPGPVTSPLSWVPNDLIRAGAPLARDAEDVLAELGLGTGGAMAASPELPPGLARVLAALAGPPEAPEAVAARSGAPMSEVLTALLDLEIRGLVRRAGGRFERTLLAGR